jgi:hypothetical protein
VLRNLIRVRSSPLATDQRRSGLEDNISTDDCHFCIVSMIMRDVERGLLSLLKNEVVNLQQAADISITGLRGWITTHIIVQVRLFPQEGSVRDSIHLDRHTIHKPGNDMAHIPEGADYNISLSTTEDYTTEARGGWDRD